MAADAWSVVDRVPPLTADDVHVWQATLDRDEPTVRRLEALLDAGERDRASRFHFRLHRERYIVGRGLLRLLLAEYGEGRPDILRLSYN
jgi:4'-phosphopantetheinyl transferase